MKPTEQKLLSLIRKQKTIFQIPVFQRNYVWDEELCEVLFRDVRNTASENMRTVKRRHFFGTITFYYDMQTGKGKNNIVLVDGQQRITTTMLFLAAIRDTMSRVSEKEEINKLYLINQGLGFKMRLKQAKDNLGVFGDVILNHEFDESEKKTAIYNNYHFFKKKLEGMPQRELELLVQKGLDEFTIVTLELRRLLQCQKVKILNTKSRGKKSI